MIGDDVAAGLGNLQDGGDQGIPFGDGRSVAARVVGEVEQHHGFALLRSGVLQLGLEGVTL